jgi:TolB-like protein
MKNKTLLILVVFMFSSIVSFGTASGGQIVTDEAKAWAKQALEKERSLRSVTGPNTVAVLYFFNRTGQPDLDPLQKGITIMLITDLSKVRSLVVVERIRLQALLEEMKLGVSGLVEDNAVPRVGKTLGAHWLVGGNILTGQPGILDIKSSVLDVPTTQITGETGVQGILEDLLRLEKDLVSGIIKYLRIEPTPEEEMELRKPITINVKALFEFSRCIDLSDRKNYQEAIKSCEYALRHDPNFSLAREALNELRDMSAGKSVELLNSIRGRTSLNNQLTPQEPVKRLVTPQVVTTIENTRPPLPEPSPSPLPRPTPSPQPGR